MASLKRYQVQQKFWLNKNNEEQRELIDYCEELRNPKTKYNFASTIRDALRLIRDLRNGKLDVLFELFPFVKLEILDYMKDVKTDNNDNHGEHDIKQQIARLEQLILSQNKPDTHVMKPLNGLQSIASGKAGINHIGSIKQIEAPDFDDEDEDLELVTISVNKDAGKRATQNFLQAMQALQQ